MYNFNVIYQHALAVLSYIFSHYKLVVLIVQKNDTKFEHTFSQFFRFTPSRFVPVINLSFFAVP